MTDINGDEFDNAKTHTSDGTFSEGVRYTDNTPSATFGEATWNNTTSTMGSGSVKKRHPGKVILKIVAAVLVLGLCMGMGYLGAELSNRNNDNKVVINKVNSTNADTLTSTAGTLTSEQVAAKVEPTVVAITTENMTVSNNWFGSYVTGGAGSGVILSENGYIITSAHVITGASKITVQLHDGKEYEAQVVGSYVEGDIAVIKIDATGLTPAEVADSDTVKQGAVCYAVGNPEGQFSGSISEGIVSALDRTISVTVENESYGNNFNQSFGFGFSFGNGLSSSQTIQLNVIQMTAAVSPGNSGGALYNANGELIGIVSAKSSDNDSEGLGFAIDSNTALEIATQLIDKGTYEGEGTQTSTNKAVLGITVRQLDSQAAAQYGFRNAGVYVAAISLESTFKAGLKVGDRIISIDEVMVTQTTDLTGYLADKNVGDYVTLSVERDGKMVSVTITLAANSGN